jgi:hypothetical protein
MNPQVLVHALVQVTPQAPPQLPLQAPVQLAKHEPPQTLLHVVVHVPPHKLLQVVVHVPPHRLEQVLEQPLRQPATQLPVHVLVQELQPLEPDSAPASTPDLTSESAPGPVPKSELESTVVPDWASFPDWASESTPESTSFPDCASGYPDPPSGNPVLSPLLFDLAESQASPNSKTAPSPPRYPANFRLVTSIPKASRLSIGFSSLRWDMTTPPFLNDEAISPTELFVATVDSHIVPPIKMGYFRSGKPILGARLHFRR